MARLYGDWGRFEMWRRKIASGASFEQMASEIGQFGESAKSVVVGHIFAQDLRWKKLSKVTLAKKGGRQKIYWDTGEFVDSIQVEVQDRGLKGVRLEVKPTGQHSTGIDMQELAAVLEYGNSKTPARPLWRPSFREIKKHPDLNSILDLKKRFGF